MTANWARGAVRWLIATLLVVTAAAKVIAPAPAGSLLHQAAMTLGCSTQLIVWGLVGFEVLLAWAVAVPGSELSDRRVAIVLYAFAVVCVVVHGVLIWSGSGRSCGCLGDSGSATGVWLASGLCGLCALHASGSVSRRSSSGEAHA
jgi:hypothetical protein